MDESTLYLAWISEKLTSCSAAFKKMYDILGNAKDIYKISDYSIFGLTEKQTAALMDKDLSSAQRAINSAINIGFDLMPYNDERYPQKLKKLSNPPPLLYFKGKWVDFDKYYSVGVVGTRHPTAEALQKTRTVSHALAEKGIIIISGLAFGIDCEAHKEALKARAFTVGISGVKAGQIYPKENSRLYTNLYNSGLVICENSPVAKIMKNSFPSRNRIISALSDAILMMEAPAKSGAIITAEHALSNKKAVFVPFGDEKYNEGGNALLKKGASLLSSHENVLEHLTNLNKDFYTEKTAPTLQEELRDLENNNISLDKNVSSDMETTNDLISISIPDELSENEKKIYVFISSKDSVSADSIFMELDIPRNEIVASLSMLEICGYIIRIPGDKWKLL